MGASSNPGMTCAATRAVRGRGYGADAGRLSAWRSRASSTSSCASASTVDGPVGPREPVAVLDAHRDARRRPARPTRARQQPDAAQPLRATLGHEQRPACAA